jgi:hypothetical protein
LTPLPTRFSNTWRTRPTSPIRPARHVVCDLERELDVLLRGAGREQVEDFFDRLIEIVGDVFQFDAARLDLGEVEDVVDDDQQALGRAADRAREIVCSRSSLVSSSRLLKPITPFIGVRISWLYRRKEFALGAVGGFGLVARFGHLRSRARRCAPTRRRACVRARRARRPVRHAAALPDRRSGVCPRRRQCGPPGAYVMLQLAPRCHRQQYDDSEQARSDLHRIVDQVLEDRAHVHADQDSAALLAIGADERAVDRDRRDEIEVSAVDMLEENALSS